MLTAAARLGVLGWPVAHSRSPQMHNAALVAAGLGDWRYQLLPVAPELFVETVKALPAAGFRGANVTIPHKEAAAALADDADPAVAEIGAANTLIFDDGAIRARNTDAPGLIAALPVSPRGKSALVLGAGGSARAAVWALRREGAEVRIWNRTHERAAHLGGELGAVAVSTAEPADLLVNCTPAGMDGNLASFKTLPIKSDEIGMFRCVADLAYTGAETPLISAAKAQGIPVVDGLDVLVAQGALSFEQFTGLAAPIEQMRAAARA